MSLAATWAATEAPNVVHTFPLCTPAKTYHNYIIFNIQLDGGWTSWVHVNFYLYSWSLSSAVFVLITYTDRTSLYCSSEYLIVFEMGEVQTAGPTAFCTLTGLWCSWLLPAEITDHIFKHGLPQFLICVGVIINTCFGKFLIIRPDLSNLLLWRFCIL